MMATFREMKVQEIVADASLSRDEKVEQLRAIETEARGLQRAASESPMNPGDGWDDELRAARKALDDLGAEDLSTGAASL